MHVASSIMPIMISSAGPWLYGLSTAVAQSNKWQNFVAKSKSFVINWLCRWMDELKKWHWKKGKAAQQCCWRRCMPLIRPHRRCNIKLNIPIIIAHRLYTRKRLKEKRLTTSQSFHTAVCDLRVMMMALESTLRWTSIADTSHLITRW